LRWTARRGGAAGPVKVSPLLAEALGVALRAARATGGDVDPTIGAAMIAAGYDRDFAVLRRNGPPVRLTVRSVPGWRQIELDEGVRAAVLPGRDAP
jgi:thiamine biosynthesis lipoprotein